MILHCELKGKIFSILAKYCVHFFTVIGTAAQVSFVAQGPLIILCPLVVQLFCRDIVTYIYLCADEPAF